MEPSHGSKVPAVSLGFWVIKILATTLGETGGDTLSMTYELGYLASSIIFTLPLIVLVVAQVRARKFHPFLYWATIVASTTAGTTIADFATRSLGIGYPGGAMLLLAGVVTTLVLWRLTTGTVAMDSVDNARAESWYWATITISQTLGTALGDWAADDGGLGYLGGAALFGAALAVIVLAWRFTRASRAWLFWLAFILTRPLGATVGDFLDKPPGAGGLGFSRPLASAVLCAAMLVAIVLWSRRPGPRSAGS